MTSREIRRSRRVKLWNSGRVPSSIESFMAARAALSLGVQGMFEVSVGIWKKQLLALAAVLLLGLGSAGVANAALDLGPGESFQTNYLELPAGGIAGGNSGAIESQQQRSPLSTDGRYMAFISDANTLDPAADPDVTNVFRKDRTTGAVELVSRATGADGAGADNSAHSPSISADGNLIAFVTEAKLAPADADDAFDVYVRNLAADTTTLATPGTNEAVPQADLSANGLFVAFTAYGPLVPGDLNLGLPDVYRRTLSLPVSDETYDLVSKKAVSDNAGAGISYYPSISGDGKWVAYASTANDLVAGFVDNNTNNNADIYVRDMTGPTNYLVSSRFNNALQGANGAVVDPQIAGTPNTLAEVKVGFFGEATDVVAPGIDNTVDYSVFLKPMSGNPSTLISQSSTEVNGTNTAGYASVSNDGNLVLFISNADNFGPSSGGYGVYVRDISAGTTTLASADNVSGLFGDVSGDGTIASWCDIGGATPDSDDDAFGVFTRSLPGGPIKFTSRPTGDVPYLLPAAEVDHPETGSRQISADGRYAVFTSATHRLQGGGKYTVYRRDLQTGEVVAVSRATGADGAFPTGADSASISADGTRVSFISFSSLAAADDNTEHDVYVRDLIDNTTTLVSRADGADGAVGDQESDFAAISGDGKRVVFNTDSTNFGVAGGFDQVFVRDLATNQTFLASRQTGALGNPGNGDSDSASISGDGKVVVFGSTAFNFNVDDPNNDRSIYVRNLDTDVTTLESRREGPGGMNAAGFSFDPVISADGRVIAWETEDQEVAPEAGAFPGGNYQVVSRVLATGANTLVSRVPDGPPSDEGAENPTISGDGSVIAFDSQSTNLVAGLGGPGHTAVFARQMATGALSGPPAFGKGDFSPQHGSGTASLSDNGNCMAYVANGHNAISGDSSDLSSQYVYVVRGTCSDPRQNEIIDPPPPTAPKPKLTKVKLTNKKFAVGKKPTAKVSAKKKAKKGTKIKFTLNTTASVTFRIERKVPGRKKGKKCVKVTKKNKAKKKCSRFVKAGKLVRKGQKKGARTVVFSGRIGKKKLKPGKYRVAMTAYNKSGASKKVIRPFTIVKK
jgi:Tol biopolymer transport system component